MDSGFVFYGILVCDGCVSEPMFLEHFLEFLFFSLLCPILVSVFLTQFYLFFFLDACLYLNEREKECVIWVGGKEGKIWEKSGEGNHAQNILY